MPGSESVPPSLPEAGASKPKKSSAKSSKKYVAQEPKVDRTPGGLRNSFVDTLAWLITVVWVISFGASLVPSWDYSPPAAIHVLMTTVAGAAFGGNLIKKIGGGE